MSEVKFKGRETHFDAGLMSVFVTDDEKTLDLFDILFFFKSNSKVQNSFCLNLKLTC